MASQAPTDAPPAESQTLPDRTANPADNAAPQGETSKNAAKKAAKAAKQASEKAAKAANKGQAKDKAKAAPKAPKKKIEGAALIGIDVSKEEDFPGWYQQVLTKGDMLDYYDVSGCFILKVRLSPFLTPCATPLRRPELTMSQPASYSIWEEIQQWFNIQIKKIGVKNCSFPLFVSEDVLQREKDHIEGFAAEVAWVTHAYGLPTFSPILVCVG